MKDDEWTSNQAIRRAVYARRAAEGEDIKTRSRRVPLIAVGVALLIVALVVLLSLAALGHSVAPDFIRLDILSQIGLQAIRVVG